MTVHTTWQCPNCGETHDGQFDTCWKCGSNPTGDRDSDFHVSEPVHDQDQAPDSPTEETQLPILQLPTVTYFSIPPFIWISLVGNFYEFQNLVANQVPDFSLSTTEIAVTAIYTVLIWIPIFITMVRFMFLCIVRRHRLSNGFAVLFCILSMFRLPDSFFRMHRWFVPIYYGSIAALFVAPLCFAAWRLIHMM